MSERYLRLIRLRLEGFGPYRDPVEFEIPAGLAVFTGPNEAGKSTMAAAISAAFFGLPSSADPEAFGTARYRNWDEPRRFEVAVEFEVDGVLHRLRRNLETHRVNLARKEAGGWRQVAGGEHNPNAKKPNASYHRWLSETFGHASRELFEATFSLRQPFAAADRLDGELQSLLSGGGSGHLDALERLVDAAKALTMRTGELGLTPRDGRRPGRLDEVRFAVRELEAQVAAGKESVEELQRISREISELTARLDEGRRRLGAVKRSLSAFDAWRQQAQKVRTRGEEVAALRRTLSQLHRLDEELAAERAALEREHPELLRAPAPLEEPLALLGEVVRRSGEVARLAGERAAVERALEEAARRRRELIPWETGREGALGWATSARRAVEDAREEWNAYQRLRRRLEELLACRTEEFRAFEEAAPAALERVGEYRLGRSVLEERLRAARALLEEEETRAREVRERAGRLAERFADVHGREHLTSEVARALRLEAEAAAAGETARAHEARVQRARRVQWAASAAVMLLLVLAVLGAIPAWEGLLLGLAGSAAAFAALYSRLPQVRSERLRWMEATRRHKRLLGELEEARRRLGPWAGKSRDELEQLRSRLADYREAMAALEGAAPDPERLDQLRDEVARLEEAFAAFEEEVAPFREAFGDFEAAFARWNELQRECRDTDEALRRLTGTWRVPEPSALTAPPFAGVWAALLPYAAPLRRVGGGEDGEGGETIEALAKLVESLDEAFWRELFQRAEAHDEVLQREVELLAEKRRLGGLNEGALGEAVEGVRRAAAALERALPGEWDAFRERLEKGLVIDELPQAWGLLPSPLRELLGRSGGLEAAKRRCEAFRAAQGRIAQLEARREGALHAAGCENESSLERRLAEAEAGLAVAVQEFEALTREHPGLPARGEAEAFEAIARRIEELEQEQALLEAELDRGEERLRELGRRQAGLQGTRPVNLAQAELELVRLRREEERLEFEARAIAVAHAQLREAAEAYYAGHLERLVESAGAYFVAFSRRTGRRVAFDPEGRLQAIEAGGREIPVAALSQGARDQLYLAFRMGIADLLSWNRALPLIFDDPFVNCDEERLEAIRRVLETLAYRRQILLFSHREAFRSWGAPIEVRHLEEIDWKEGAG